jgi:formate dehydrogenase subunit gamma
MTQAPEGDRRLEKERMIQPGDAIRPGHPPTVSRYGPLVRANHWFTALCLITLAVSGMALFTPSLYFLTGLFGGGQNTRAFHPWVGVALFFSFAALFVQLWRANLPNKTDVVWLSRFKALAHAFAAVIIILIWIAHVYASIWIQGTMRAMTRGSVTAGWAYRHHRKWLKELVSLRRKGSRQNAAE